ncbi:MAG: peptide deformylase [Eggerthellaceae bacterium]|uniref:Peptide deformylase n=1 Tax=Denitrobacterium detoxificans TaxID=79604 RepID=A0A172RYG9_9ACTN|nr:peptide deformylase [Denitrobacterium detoxificans]ANE22771.1 peptide deformylase [Denitrobacterium detoxificans]MCR5582008.1 peptide deformylase [Eggerthellaceae bacterium]SEO77280.1 peptide deformylase [Denitrobacterium detoxificans]
MKIVLSPDPMLRQRAEECEPGDPSLKRLSKRMARTMYNNDGCGLAAPQVGVLKRIIVIDCDTESETQNPITLVNPVIVETSGEPEVAEEGCLSLPGISVPVKRPPYARVRYYDVDGNECEIAGDGLLGRCLQHEIDHLDGKTLFESCDPIARIKALRDYDAAIAAGARPGQTAID